MITKWDNGNCVAAAALAVVVQSLWFMWIEFSWYAGNFNLQ